MIFRMEVEVNELGDIEDYLGVVGRSINTGIPLDRFDSVQPFILPQHMSSDVRNCMVP